MERPLAKLGLISSQILTEPGIAYSVLPPSLRVYLFCPEFVMMIDGADFRSGSVTLRAGFSGERCDQGFGARGR